MTATTSWYSKKTTTTKKRIKKKKRKKKKTTKNTNKNFPRSPPRPHPLPGHPLGPLSPRHTHPLACVCVATVAGVHETRTEHSRAGGRLAAEQAGRPVTLEPGHLRVFMLKAGEEGTFFQKLSHTELLWSHSQVAPPFPAGRADRSSSSLRGGQVSGPQDVGEALPTVSSALVTYEHFVAIAMGTETGARNPDFCGSRVTVEDSRTAQTCAVRRTDTVLSQYFPNTGF